MKAVLLFVDGLGIGKRDTTINPCTQDETDILNVCQDMSGNSVDFDGIVTGLDATLGISGLPQSATGQTAILTGINASKLLGYHLSGFPNKPLRELLLHHSILLKTVQLKKKAAFINTFRPIFFSLAEKFILRMSATTIANYGAKLPFFQIEDILEKRSIYQDFTNISLLERGFEVPIFSPEEAADILVNAMADYDFILYEYFQTDKVGHKQDMGLAVNEINKLSRFIHRLLGHINLKNTLIILTSDHGNIEDISTKSHTRNLAMTFIWGPNNTTIAEKMHSITDVTPALLEFLRSIK